MAGGAEVVVLDVAASQPGLAVRRGHLEVFFLGDDEHVGRMGPRRGIGLARGDQLLAAVLAERFEHHEAQLAFLRGPLHEQAVVHERRDAVQHVDAKVFERIADSLRGFERAASGEDRQTAEELLLGRRQQVVAPLDRLPKGLLALRQVPRPAGQELEGPFDPGEQLGGRQDLHARGRELDRERQAIEPAADLDHRAGVLRGQREVGPAGRRALDEQRDRRAIHQGRWREQRAGRRERERRDRKLLLAVDVQALPAGHEDRQRRAGVQQVLDERGRIRHLLEVVEEQQRRAAAAQVLGDRALE